MNTLKHLKTMFLSFIIRVVFILSVNHLLKVSQNSLTKSHLANKCMILSLSLLQYEQRSVSFFLML